MTTTSKGGRFATRGSRTYDALVEKRGLSSEKAGLELRPAVGRIAVHNWRHGYARPNLMNRASIAQWSREVDPVTKDYGPPTIAIDDWLLDEEREAMRAVMEAS